MTATRAPTGTACSCCAPLRTRHSGFSVWEWAARCDRRAIRAARRHEKVRVGRVPEGLDAPWSTSPPEDTVDDVAAALAAEGVSTRGVLGGDIVGRRADGSLVSKHDVLLDGRLKASLLSARVAGAGDLSDQRVPARAYHDLVAFQHRQESRGDRGGS